MGASCRQPVSHVPFLLKILRMYDSYGKCRRKWTYNEIAVVLESDDNNNMKFQLRRDLS